MHYYKETGHFYKVVRSENAKWQTVQAAAEAGSYLGLSSYLAHITSQGEDESVFFCDDVPNGHYSGDCDNITLGFEYNNWNTDLGQPDDDLGANNQQVAVIIHEPSL